VSRLSCPFSLTSNPPAKGSERIFDRLTRPLSRAMAKALDSSFSSFNFRFLTSCWEYAELGGAAPLDWILKYFFLSLSTDMLDSHKNQARSHEWLPRPPFIVYSIIEPRSRVMSLSSSKSVRDKGGERRNLME
jgi:hypothetical protein